MDYAFNSGVIWANLDKFLSGLALGLGLAFAALLAGTIIGLICAFSASGSAVSRRLVDIYVSAFRNTPLLVIILFAYFALPQIVIRLGKIESFIVSLAIYSGSYLTEVFRAGLAGVPKGVIDAGRAIGLQRFQVTVNVIAPIMFRNCLPSLGTTFISLRNSLPALGSTFISLFKDTSLAAVIAVPELTYQARKLNTETFRVAEAWLTASLLYLGTCLIIAWMLRFAERRYPKF
jgi:polar amino acid transport system permease protein